MAPFSICSYESVLHGVRQDLHMIRAILLPQRSYFSHHCLPGQSYNVDF